MRIRRARAERFGALVAVEDPPALVSVDRVLARRIGVDGGRLWEGPPDGDALTGPTEVHVAATDRCPAGCHTCYADAQPDGHEPALDEVRRRLDAIARLGVFSVAFGGGEAGLRPDVQELALHARSLGMVPTLTTSGLGMTPDRARSFRAFAQVNVSWDGPADTYAEVRGWDGAGVAERAVALLREAGVPVGINTVVTRHTFERLDAIAEGVEHMGAGELQLLRLKPTGRGKLGYLAQRLTAAQVQRTGAVLRRLSERRRMAIRVDCAMVPFLAADGSLAPADLARFGVMGCEAGRSLMTLDARGRARPCSFWEPDARAPADDADAERAWTDDADLGRFRAHAAAPPEPCRDCPYRPVCRGGCRVVSRHLTGDPWLPDPECPRVRTLRGSRRK